MAQTVDSTLRPEPNQGMWPTFHVERPRQHGKSTYLDLFADIPTLESALSVPALAAAAASRSASAPPGPATREDEDDEQLQQQQERKITISNSFHSGSNDHESSESLYGEQKENQSGNMAAAMRTASSSCVFWGLSRSSNPEPGWDPEEEEVTSEAPHLQPRRRDDDDDDDDTEEGNNLAKTVTLVRPNPLKTNPPLAANAETSSNSLNPIQAVSTKSTTIAGLSGAGQRGQAVEKEAGSLGGDIDIREKGVDYSPWCEAAVIEKEAEARRRVEERAQVHNERQSNLSEVEGNIHTVFNGDNTMPPTNSARGSGSEARRGNNHTSDNNDYPHHIQNANNHAAQIRNHIRSGVGTASLSGAARGLRGGGGSVKRGDNNNDEEAASRTMQPAPYFERLVTEEVQELKAYVRIIENQNRRLAELERVHGDLEGRLEAESRGRQQVEATLEAREREWSEKFEQLAKERDHWKEVVQAEQVMNSRLKEQVLRKDQEIHRMLQRKYDHEGGGGRPLRNLRAGQQQHPERGDRTMTKSPELRPDILQKSPHEILKENGSVEKARVRNVEGLLLDFFGL